MSLERHTVSSRRVGVVLGIGVLTLGGLVAAAGMLGGVPRTEAAVATATQPSTAAAGAGDIAPSQRPTSASDPAAVDDPLTGVPPEPVASPDPFAPGEHSAETTPEEVVEATQVAADFVAAYATYRYDDAPGAAAERVAELVTDELAETLSEDHGGAAGRAELAQREEVVTAVVETVQRQGGGGGWLDLAVVVRQDVVTVDGGTSRWSSYLTRVVRTGDGWRVAGFQP